MPSGRAIYYLKDQEMVIVPVETAPAFVAGKAKTLFADVAPLIVDSAETYHVAPKGDRFVMTRPVDERAAAPEVRIALNWFGELRRR